jgi:uncharacterized membrane protein
MRSTSRTGRSRVPLEERSSRHLRPGARKAMKTAHVIVGVALLGNQLGLLVLVLSAALTNDAGLRHATYELVRTLIFALEIPLAVTALVSGVVLSVRTRWGLFQHYWIIGKVGLTVGTALVGILGIRRWTEEMILVTGPRAVVVAPLPAARWLLAAALALTITALATATGLSVYKPRGQTRGSGSLER